MWFAKLWGRSKDDEQDDEPARHPSVRVAQGAPRAPAPGVAAATRPANAAARKGFDPYNSGVFKRDNAWERVGRR